MNIVNSVAVVVAVATGSLAAPIVCADTQTAGPSFISVTASELKWTDAPSVGPGAQIAVIEGDLKTAGPFTFRLKLPPNLVIGVHTHPGHERVTVISGSFNFATGDKFDSAKAKSYNAGDLFIVPPGMAMYGETKNEGAILQIHGTGPWGMSYLDAQGTPEKK